MKTLSNFLVFLFMTGICFSEELETTILLEMSLAGIESRSISCDNEGIWLIAEAGDSLYRMSPFTRLIEKSIPSPTANIYRLAYDGTNLWCADSLTSIFYLIEPINGFVIDSLQVFLGHSEPENIIKPTGLGWNDDYLLSCIFDGWSSQIVTIDTNSAEVTRIGPTQGYPNGVAFANESVWNCSIINAGAWANVDEYTFQGLRVNFFDLPCSYPSGIDYDGSSFWIIDSTVDSLFNIVLTESYIPGDINGDGLQNILDITLVIEFIFGELTTPYMMYSSDVNQDMALNVLDIVILIEMII